MLWRILLSVLKDLWQLCTTKFAIALALLMMFFSAAIADEGHHHEELTEQQLGTVHFPVSCAPAVQKSFQRGVALLHSFAFESAEAVFREVLRDDSHCAMAHWGIARSFWRWSEPDATIRNQGWNEVTLAKSLHPSTKREKEYIAAVAALYKNPKKADAHRWDRYLAQMQQLHKDYPEDHEATAFYAYALVAADSDDDPQHAQRKQAAALLEPLFAAEPNHPGVAHYLIHAYDKADLARLGLPAARKYAQIASAAPHALHMPSHIFAQLGLWQEDIASNLASAAASRNTSSTHMGDEGHQYHAMEFLMYAYLQSGREAEARKLIDGVRALPKMKSMYGIEADPQIDALLAYSAAYVLELHQWEQAEVLPLTTGTKFGDDINTYAVRAIAAARLGHLDQAHQAMAEIESIHKQLIDRKLQVGEWMDQEQKEAQAWIDHAEGKDDQALDLLRGLAEKETTGVFAADGELPAREMLADMLLELKRLQQALVEYEGELKINPGRFNSLYGAGKAAELADLPDKARTYYEQLVNECATGNSDRPELAHARSFLSVIAK